MKKKNPRFEVFNGETSVVTTNEIAKMAKKVIELQKEKAPVIIINNYVNQEITTYKKQIHEKNYRVSVKKEVQLVFSEKVPPQEAVSSE